MTLAPIYKRRLLFGADRLRLPATRPKPAAGGRVCRAGHVALEHDPLPASPLRRLLDRYGRQQRLCVGVRGPLVDVLPRPDLDDLAEIHDRDAIGDVANEREIVRDEEVCKSEVALQRLEQVHDLGTDGDVERRDGLVEEKAAAEASR